jgi:hypothetical protein
MSSAGGREPETRSPTVQLLRTLGRVFVRVFAGDVSWRVVDTLGVSQKDYVPAAWVREELKEDASFAEANVVFIFPSPWG